MKKTAVAALALAGILVLGGGSVYAAGQIARSTAISEATALSFACVDAELLPEQVSDLRTRFLFHRGGFAYALTFTAEGSQYAYLIDSVSGEVLKKEAEQQKSAAPAPASPEPRQTAAPAASSRPDSPALSDAAPRTTIGVEKAKAIALERSGLKAEEVQFTKAKLDRESAREVYDVEFILPGKASYEYEIDAVTGAVLEEGFEALNQPQPTREPAPQPTQQPTPQPTQQPTPQPTPSQGSVSGISLEEAKAIALKRAGAAAGDVVFSKAKQEREDGRLIYDIEFYLPGGMEYEYEIDAATGAVLEEDSEPWEAYDD